MHLPLVSVVMSVRNGGKNLLGSIQSILEQRDLNFEFILVNDGSTDGTDQFLSLIAKKDPRVRLLTREAKGLTMSLIEGCMEARGEFIARQDAYDYSTPDRLRIQAERLQSETDASMCSSHVRFITQERVGVFVQAFNESVTQDGLFGIIHGSTMFRKDAYMKVGGYREEFYYAQDVDLWSRLVEIGRHTIIPQILYENCIHPGSISSARKKEQTTLHSFIMRATKARREGRDESIWLARASSFSVKCRLESKKKVNQSRGAYFIGSCLMKDHPLLAKKYLRMSLQSNPLSVRTRLKILSLK